MRIEPGTICSKCDKPATTRLIVDPGFGDLAYGPPVCNECEERISRRDDRITVVLGCIFILIFGSFLLATLFYK